MHGQPSMSCSPRGMRRSRACKVINPAKTLHPPRGALASAKGGHRTLQSAPRLQLPGSGQGFKTLDHTHWLDCLASSAQGAASPRCTSSSFLNSSYSTSTSAPARHPSISTYVTFGKPGFKPQIQILIGDQLLLCIEQAVQ